MNRASARRADRIAPGWSDLMASHKTIIIVLLFTLIGSNAFWLYQSIDSGISYTYMEASASDCQRTLGVAIAVIPIIADPNSDKSAVVLAVKKVSDVESFEKDGLVWIGGLGLGFDDSDRVAIASGGPLNSYWPQT